jgi:ATP-dependent Clp protease adaptor protein ClpS
MSDKKEPTKADVKPGTIPMFKVLLHNDDETTMGFVMAILIQIFRKDEQTAHKIMMEVHEKGVGLIVVEPYERAEFHHDQVVSLARAQGFPLSVSIEAA